MAPTSGGQYHWVSMLAPPSSRKFLGYLTAWLALTGWQALVASGGYVTGTMMQGLILLTHPEYGTAMQNWHGTLLFWGVVLLGFGINSALGSLLAKFEGLVLVVHLLGFFAIMLPLALLSEHGDSAAVFNNFYNLGDWQTQGLSFCIGLLGNVFAFLGADGAIHVSLLTLRVSALLLTQVLDGRGNSQCGRRDTAVSTDRSDDKRDTWVRHAYRHFILRGSLRHRRCTWREPIVPVHGHLPPRRRIYRGRGSDVVGHCDHGIQRDDRLPRIDLTIVLGFRSRPWASWMEHLDEDESTYEYSSVCCAHNNFYCDHTFPGQHRGCHGLQRSYIYLHRWPVRVISHGRFTLALSPTTRADSKP